ncbi:MAG: hypothetical protein ABI642_02395 [Polaromonas sp.]
MIGNSSYTGIAGYPNFYLASGSSTTTLNLTSIVARDKSGNPRKFFLVTGDSEYTADGEQMRFTQAGGTPWAQLELLSNPSGGPAGTLALTGLGTSTVTFGGNGTNGPNLLMSTKDATSVGVSFVADTGSTLFALGLPKVTLIKNNTAGRINSADQTQIQIAYTTPTVALATATTNGASLSATAATATSSVLPGNVITLSESMAIGSVTPQSGYTGSISCSNSGPGASTFGGVNTVLPSGAGTSFMVTPQVGDNITCTISNAPAPQTVTGIAYSDANHNASLDGSEGGVAGLFVKLAPLLAGVCQSAASAAAVVDPSTGAYSLLNVAPGNYCLVLDTNNVPSDITPGTPVGWIGTQNVAGVIQINVSGIPPPPQNFGLYNGSKLSGMVFADTGVGAGTANNGMKDGSEPGLASVAVGGTQAATTFASASTAGDGGYTLWLPASVAGAVVITAAAPSGYMATGGSVGAPPAGASYSRPSVINFTPVAGQTYTGVNFGLVPVNTLSPNGAQTGQPGTVVFYAHTFTAGSGGQLALSLANAATPAGLPWSQVLYRDSDCSSTLQGSEPQVSAPITVTAGQTLCLIVKQFIPAAAATGATNTTTLSAAFSYTSSIPLLSSTLTANDVTTVGLQGALALNKLVKNITLGGLAATTVVASPGNVLEYSLKAQNNGSEPLTTLVINDATPAFTTYLSAACPGALPSGVSACSVSSQPAMGAQGNLQWTFTGSLLPGAQLSVTYKVTVNQ